MRQLGEQMASQPGRARFGPTRMPRLLRHQRGTFAIMTAALILVMLGFCGLAIDLGRVYNRKIELQNLADAAALAAAAELDGTREGIDRAVAAAADSAGRNFRYEYGASMVQWSGDALRFSAAPAGGTWLSANEARNQPQDIYHAEVDTANLANVHGHVALALIPVLPSASASAQMSGRAVAGRTTINVLPFALCAMSDKRGAPRGDELVEYGFRRGISYNLMKLNPNGTTTGANFLVNPIAPPGSSGGALKSRLDIIRPFVCTGTMAMPRVTGGTITVEPDFPLGAVAAQLNSRFGTYEAPCTAAGAPPDTNVKEYTVSSSTNAIGWLVKKPAGQSAASTATSTSLVTVADVPADPNATTTAEMYGPLWIYAKAAKFENYDSTKPEPAGAGYTTFSATSADWAKLYTPGSPQLQGTYPTPVPAKSAAQTLAPVGLAGVADRRILHVPLLRCPVGSSGAGPAEVLAVAKFYMTVKATSDDLIGEFTGLARPDALRGQVELRQ